MAAGLRDLYLGGGRVVPARLLSVRFARSGGPGGQHVNRTETKADVRLDLDSCVDVLGADAVARIRRVYENRLDADGQLVVVRSENRSQARNVAAAVDFLEELLREALRPTRRRKPTKPTRSSQRRRVDEKRHRGQIKKWRRGGED